MCLSHGNFLITQVEATKRSMHEAAKLMLSATLLSRAEEQSCRMDNVVCDIFRWVLLIDCMMCVVGNRSILNCISCFCQTPGSGLKTCEVHLPHGHEDACLHSTHITSISSTLRMYRDTRLHGLTHVLDCTNDKLLHGLESSCHDKY
jgi:hypothetical protein